MRKTKKQKVNMAILVDYSAVAVASCVLASTKNVSIDKNYARHLILNIIRSVRKKFYAGYGEIILCVDSKKYWRKDIFPYYKASRKAARKESTLDWSSLFEIIDTIQMEIELNFPYKVLKVDNVEADDIIGVIAIREPGPHMIVSNDKDFKQLQKIPGVAMYSPNMSSIVKCDNPDTFLIEHILRGDQSDGIPNVLSDDDTFVVAGKRQKRLTEAKVREWSISVPVHVFQDEILENYYRNERLISLFKIPDDIAENIHNAFKNKQVTGKRGMKLMKYFMDNSLRNLMEDINEF